MPYIRKAYKEWKWEEYDIDEQQLPEHEKEILKRELERIEEKKKKGFFHTE